MKLILTHLNPDFDALASLALARLLHPDAVPVLEGGMHPQVEAFVRLYRDVLAFEEAEHIDPGAVRELIVVDTNVQARLGPLAQALGSVPITIYDHHPKTADSLVAGQGITRSTGACVTILTLILEAQGIPISAEIASLGLLGIHDDTGNMRYSTTTADDYRAAAILVAAGASFRVLQDFQDQGLDRQHRDSWHEVMNSAQLETIAGHPVVVAELTQEDYVYGQAAIAEHLLSLYEADAALLVIALPDQTLLIARAEPTVFDVGAALAEAFAGGGHAGAAFARTTLAVEEVKRQGLIALGHHVQAGLLARDLMSYPVKTIEQSLPIHAAKLQLVRSGHNGFPVLFSEQLVGMLSRRDIERAERHQMSEQPVSAIMTRKVIEASPYTSQRELEQLIKTHRIGRIPIVENGELVGIVTRTDVLDAYHSNAEHQDVAALVLRRLPKAAKDVLKFLKKIVKGRLFVVGGTVRDALIGSPLKDLDLMVQAEDAEHLAMVLAKAIGGEVKSHRGFGTASLSLESGLEVDIATAREEFYTHPGALPSVTPSTLSKDLARRDFSINTMAVEVIPEQRFIDLFQGREDLERKILRALHPLLFVEDATRIIRGVRLAARLGLGFDNESKLALQRALKSEILQQTSGSRFRAELMLCLEERRVAPIFLRLADLGALEIIYHMRYQQALATLDSLRTSVPVPAESYLLILLMSIEEEQLVRHKSRFQWPKRLMQERQSLLQARASNSLEGMQVLSLSEAAQVVLKVLSPELKAGLEALLHAPPRRKLSGQDVIDLGLEEGPVIGAVLREVGKARSQQQVLSFEEELELAKALVQARVGEKHDS